MNSTELVIKMLFDRWNALLKNFDSILHTISDEQLQQEIAPGRNRGIYLLGHLIAVHDDMLPLLNLGEREYPDLFELFIKSPDKTVDVIPTAQELRMIWKTQLETLTSKLKSLSADDWFTKHNSVSVEDFTNEPHRNKLNILITRTTHLAYHVGQMILLKNKA